ncbi:hypothetical protein DICPUDRAFT_74111 [Dictyostelium purpureum]|uniref:NAD(P)-binding domain-containing protein n=1 Tax=Dictyostelium purpureum TaxID=5786 RepID=F0Z6N7_DICPU|nr:uncharacterized protein DICPUDRAFT_74111 [Dictyostelium purpureum]EGC40391.1 hypothetical protein DICPUDRAFT_74111 [Dictyostelium purpureum]|eukprot:XP_003283142.1 hypothetical protein DICPUDRAFT_74111 [Dictyostelium purpureum]
MATKGAKAILIGGTGATGKPLVKELINSPHFCEITSLVRTIDPNVTSDKLKQVVVDFEKLENYKSEFEGKDVAFNVFGTSKKQAGSTERFKEIEYGYSAKFADLSKESGVRSMHLLTSGGSNPNSWMYYLKVKGEIEEKYKEENFNFLSIFRPGFLVRHSDRWSDSVIGFFLKGLKVNILAKALRIEAENEILNMSKNNQIKAITGDAIVDIVKIFDTQTNN